VIIVHLGNPDRIHVGKVESSPKESLEMKRKGKGAGVNPLRLRSRMVPKAFVLVYLIN
jgi:hypothetical protein